RRGSSSSICPPYDAPAGMGVAREGARLLTLAVASRRHHSPVLPERSGTITTRRMSSLQGGGARLGSAQASLRWLRRLSGTKLRPQARRKHRGSPALFGPFGGPFRGGG